MTNFIRICFFACLISVITTSCNFTPKKDRIVSDVIQSLKANKSVYFQIIDTFQHIKSLSKDWELENLVGSGINFVSNDSTTPTYVPDFKIPSNFKSQIKQINVRLVQIIKDSLNETEKINFCFSSYNFPPITRTVILSYFPKDVPDSLKNENTYIDKVNWAKYIDNKWILFSVGK